MKRNIKYIFAAVGCSLLLTSCLDTVTPTEGLTQGQVESSKSGIEGLNNAIAKQMIKLGYSDISCGYAGISVATDVLVGQVPIATPSWDYYMYLSEGYVGGNYAYSYDFWKYHYDIIKRANLLLTAVGTDTTTYAGYLGNALAYRAFAYMNAARLFEYKATGSTTLDSYATKNGLYGLTVPIITQNTTEKESQNNPRVPFYVMDRFILTDLNRAERFLNGYARDNETDANEAVVYGLKARFWLELGSRFDYNSSDLKKQLAHEDDDSLKTYDKLGITTATQCFANAAKYARMAINQGYTPMSKTDWYNEITGFNTVNKSWMWAMKIGTDDIDEDDWAWKSFVSYMSSETEFGIAGMQSDEAYREIDRSLYEKIDPADWRRYTWVAPGDAGQADSVGHYSTLLTASNFANLPAYAGLKYKPAGGNMTDYKSGSAVSIPLMRVEEMYLIEAEATAFTEGLKAGQKLLENFMNTYRCTTTAANPTPYKCTSTSVWDFEDEVIREKEIEFWGEGVAYYDLKRLRKGFSTEYDGSNTYTYYQKSVANGYVAPAMNICIPNYEVQNNKGIVNNPDPQGE
ncbi:MAG: RagB/SusD family nutrient uptake outer membrane protein [Prevotella sp.]|nr:RagB/SusD family nutrient uptake outer membrane protein [Prevotella sp.]